MSNFLYVIKCNDLYKIGVANDVESRLAQLQTGNPYPLSVLWCFEFRNAMPIEQSIHQKFEHNKVFNEWFKLSDNDLQDISQICLMLGGKINDEPTVATDEAVQDADEEMAYSELDKFNFEKMSSDGWRVEVNNNGRYWIWRRGSGQDREYISGGRFADLPDEFKGAYEYHKIRRGIVRESRQREVDALNGQNSANSNLGITSAGG